MARNIDMSKGLEALSEEDLKYLRDRGKLTPAQEKEFLGGIYNNPGANRSADLTDVPNAGDVSTAPEPGESGEGEGEGEDGEDGEGTPQGDVPYNEQDRKDLYAEVVRRNSNRPEGERMSANGRTSKPDLIDLLEDDDERRVAG